MRISEGLLSPAVELSVRLTVAGSMDFRPSRREVCSLTAGGCFGAFGRCQQDQERQVEFVFHQQLDHGGTFFRFL